MASFMDRLEAEIARRDAALNRVKDNVADLSENISGKVNETRAALAPKNIVQNLKTEYSPDKMISNYPWAAVLGAMAVGFAVVPLFKRAAASIPSQPTPPPQRVIIELKGACEIAHTTTGNITEHKPTIKEMIAEGVALVSTIGNLMQRFNPAPQEEPHNGNGNGNGNGISSHESKRNIAL